MGYDLKANNDKLEGYHFGAFSFPVLLEACGYLFASIHHGGQWYCVFDQDERMGAEYPRILSNDGFEVTADEAKIMARIARNYVAVQRSLPEENRGLGINSQAKAFGKEDVLKMLARGMNDAPYNEIWPMKIRDDFTEKFEQFAPWAEQSGGFKIY
jgi:hypothetical protein